MKHKLKKLFQTSFAPLKGFTLLEMLICIVIVALFLGGYLAYFRTEMASERLVTTKARMDDIAAALARYKNRNGGRLPPPAPMLARVDDAAFGISTTTACPGGYGANCAVRAQNTEPTIPPDPSPPATDHYVRIGAVPVATLGLPVDFISDRWGHRFVYAVSEKLTDTAIPYDPNNGAITLRGDNASTVMGPIPHKTPFVLLSPSRDGAGAVTHEGTPTGIACPASPAPNFENCSNGAVFRTGLFSTSESAASQFDSVIKANLPANSPAANCGSRGMLYGPEHPHADSEGCILRMVEGNASSGPTLGKVGIGADPVHGAMPSSGAMLDVYGELRIGMTPAAAGGPLLCTPTPERRGALRFTGAMLEWCNNGTWTTLEGPPGAVGEVGPDGLQGLNGRACSEVLGAAACVGPPGQPCLLGEASPCAGP